MAAPGGFEWGVREFKASFFDTKEIERRLEKGNLRVMSKQGAFVRKRMKSMVRYAKKSAAPGEPPKAHRGTNRFTRKKFDKKTGQTVSQSASPLRELIFFALDRSAGTVVIGPAKFGDTGAPRRLEFGGRGVFRDPFTGLKESGHWKGNPFVKPAGDAESRGSKFRELLRGFIR